MRKIIRKRILILSGFFALAWYGFWGIGMYIQSGQTYDDIFRMKVESMIGEIQNTANGPEEAEHLILEREWQNLPGPRGFAYELVVVTAEDGWLVVAVPSQRSRWVGSVGERILFLDFRKIYYPLMAADSWGTRRTMNDWEEISRIKSSLNSTGAIEYPTWDEIWRYGDE